MGAGAPQRPVDGTVLVPRLIRWRGARTALILGACGVTATTALLTATRTSHIALAAGGSAAPAIIAASIGLLAIIVTARAVRRA